MLFSQLFSKTTKAFPKDEEAVNAKYLLRGGFIRKMSAGVFTFLPLGFRVLQKVVNIVREEMNAIGAEELLMNALVAKEYWTKTGRWDVDVVFKVLDGKNPKPAFSLSWTHEELITELASKYVHSYKDLPFSAYQIQTKFRNEPRAKSGLLRGREFMMKDLYSFHRDEEDLDRFYDIVKEAYFNVFKRAGIQAVYTLAAGGDFTSSNTHEFQAICPVGEDTIYVCSKCAYAENKEISKLSGGGRYPKCEGKIKEEKAIEVGNIFPLGAKYSDAFDLRYTDEKGEKNPVVMGSYGIGVSRLMATVVEMYHDEKGIVWPESVAPFKVHLLELAGASASPAEAGRKSAKKIYEDLQKIGVEVLYDDRKASAGEKLTDADLIGLPFRLVVSPKTGDKIEVKKRNEEITKIMSFEEVIKLLGN
ncbi:MAG: hypothetical protein HYT82_01480 [Candidatus Harrisonbacteria bacterium]|nr:hypothetical protein [Candidatus Harrisonbacteria bacterium]